MAAAAAPVGHAISTILPLTSLADPAPVRSGGRYEGADGARLAMLMPRLSGVVAAVVALTFWVDALFGAALATTVGFDTYISPTYNDLANNFNETGTFSTQTPYVQSPSRGISGRSVLGYSGAEYQVA
jgi:hypothetical protein